MEPQKAKKVYDSPEDTLEAALIGAVMLLLFRGFLIVVFRYIFKMPV